jgi:hypothetical protein
MSDDGMSWRELFEIFGGSTTEMIKLKYIAAVSHEQRVNAVDSAIDWTIGELSKAAPHNANASEDALTCRL